MSENAGEPLPEKMAAQPVNLEQLVRRHLDLPTVSFYETSAEVFYTFLTNVYRDGTTSVLDGSMATCTGGSFRSSRINSELFMLGVKMPKEYPENEPNKGLSILGLFGMIEDGEISEDGKVQPKTFKHPIDTLYVTLDLDSTEFVHLIKLAKSIKILADKKGKEPRMNIVIIPQDEDEITKRGKDFEYNVLDRD